MHDESVRQARLESHLLLTPAATVVEAARHMAATQAQELWGGRFALASRTVGAPSAADVNAEFDRGHIVRTWPMRGTLHIVAAEDVAWMLSVTSERVFRSAAARHRELGLDADDFARAERIARRVLAQGGLRRADLLAAFEADGLATDGQRGYHLILALALRGVGHWGATVQREGRTTEQRFTLNDALSAAPMPEDPVAEFFRRYLRGHAPASIADFAWWTGVPITVARAAAAAFRDDASSVADDVRFAADGSLFTESADADVDGLGPAVVRALAPFEEYYISYADRSPVASDTVRAAVGPGRNGMVHPILLRNGVVTGSWTRGGEVRVHDASLDPEDAARAVRAWGEHVG